MSKSEVFANGNHHFSLIFYLHFKNRFKVILELKYIQALTNDILHDVILEQVALLDYF